MLALQAYDHRPETEFVVPGGQGRAFVVGLGQFLTITVIEGQQVGELFAWNRHDLREYLSPPHTRLTANALVPRVGARFVTNRRRPMFVLARDTVGCHDLLLAGCDPALHAPLGIPGRRSCATNAVDALGALGIRVPRLYDPVNLFMSVRVGDDGALHVAPSPSRAGDAVTLRATMEVLCVLSACPMGLIGSGDRRATDLRVRVHNERDWA